MLAPQKPGEATLKELTKALWGFYQPKRNVLSKRYVFRCRAQLAEESLAAYIASLKGLAKMCEFGATLNKQLRDQLVYGVANKDLRGKLLSGMVAHYIGQRLWTLLTTLSAHPEVC